MFTDPLASPTDFPFKVVPLEDSLSEERIYNQRPRICDLGDLREAYRMADGAIGYRCAAEPLTTYIAKGGSAQNAAGRKCLCNALLTNIGHPQVRNGGYVERGLVTAGNDLSALSKMLPSNGLTYKAAEVVRWLLG